MTHIVEAEWHFLHGFPETTLTDACNLIVFTRL